MSNYEALSLLTSLSTFDFLPIMSGMIAVNAAKAWKTQLKKITLELKRRAVVIVNNIRLRQ